MAVLARGRDIRECPLSFFEFFPYQTCCCLFSLAFFLLLPENILDFDFKNRKFQIHFFLFTWPTRKYNEITRVVHPPVSLSIKYIHESRNFKNSDASECFFFENVTGQRISTAKGNKKQSKKRKQKINVCWVHWVWELRSTMRVTYCQQQQHHDEEEEEEKGKKKQTNTHTFRRFGFFLMQISIFYLLMFPKKKKESILLLLVYFPSIFTRTLFDPSSKRLSPTHTIFELLGLHV